MTLERHHLIALKFVSSWRSRDVRGFLVGTYTQGGVLKMANNVIIPNSGVTVVGTAQDNTQTDNFYLLGGSSNQIVGSGGNINVNSLSPTETDTNNAIFLKSISGAISGVTDNFTLDGSANSLTNTRPLGHNKP